MLAIMAGPWREVETWCEANSVDVDTVITLIGDKDFEKLLGKFGDIRVIKVGNWNNSPFAHDERCLKFIAHIEDTNPL